MGQSGIFSDTDGIIWSHKKSHHFHVHQDFTEPSHRHTHTHTHTHAHAHTHTHPAMLLMEMLLERLLLLKGMSVWWRAVGTKVYSFVDRRCYQGACSYAQ